MEPTRKYQEIEIIDERLMKLQDTLISFEEICIDDSTELKAFNENIVDRIGNTREYLKSLRNEVNEGAELDVSQSRYVYAAGLAHNLCLDGLKEFLESKEVYNDLVISFDQFDDVEIMTKDCLGASSLLDGQSSQLSATFMDKYSRCHFLSDEVLESLGDAFEVEDNAQEHSQSTAFGSTVRPVVTAHSTSNSHSSTPVINPDQNITPFTM
jgi:hypothetical protein